MDRDVALRQHRHAGNTARLEVMQMDMQQRRVGFGDAAAQRRLDQVDVIEPGGAMQIDDQMNAGAEHALADSKMVMAAVIDDRLDHGNLGNLRVFLSGGAWYVQALIRS